MFGRRPVSANPGRLAMCDGVDCHNTFQIMRGQEANSTLREAGWTATPDPLGGTFVYCPKCTVDKLNMTTTPETLIDPEAFIFDDTNPVIQVVDAGHYKTGGGPNGKAQCRLEHVEWPCPLILRAQKEQTRRGFRMSRPRASDVPLFGLPKPS